MSGFTRVVIVGAGLAGAKVAESLRGWGFDGQVLLVGEEAHRPYERPALSKSYLRGRSGFEGTAVHREDFYATHDVELLVSTRVDSIDIASRTARLVRGGALGWDHLVLTSGGRPRRIGVPGANLDGVFYLRTLEDADAIRTAAGRGRRVVVVGAGWIGTEVAASLQRTGSEVALAYRSAVPFERTLGAEIGSVVASLHASYGVELYPHSSPIAFKGSGHVEAVELQDGTLIEADLVVVGVGVDPASELAEAAGIAIDDGVVTDSRLRTTAPGVFAAGDVAAIAHPRFGERVRSWHWWSALTQPPTIAANIVGVPAVYDWLPTFTSKQYDLMLEHTGYPPPEASILFRGDPAEGRFVAFWIHDGKVVAGLTAGIAGLAHHIRALVTADRPVDPALLADPDVDLAAVSAPLNQAPPHVEQPLGPEGTSGMGSG